MTGRIIQHIPAYVSGFENKTRGFASLNELLNIDFVNRFRQLPNGLNDPNFYRFSVSKHSDYEGYEYVLMAELHNGTSWYVIGYLNDTEIIKELPIWEPKSKAAVKDTLFYCENKIDEAMMQCGEQCDTCEKQQSKNEKTY
jgi:hypothetical protein